jgi:hypothetical protein
MKMGREITQTDTEWLHSELELIASNRASKLFVQTMREYEQVCEQYQFEPREAITFLKEKYEISI